MFRTGGALASAARAPSRAFARRFHASPASFKVHNITTEEQFHKDIKRPAVLVDAYATWCQPCKAMSPVVEKISTMYESVHFIQFDVDNLPKIAAELKIRAMPTFIMYANGEKVDELVGANPGMLAKMVEKHLPADV